MLTIRGQKKFTLFNENVNVNPLKIDLLIKRPKEKVIRAKNDIVDLSPIVIRYTKDHQINVLHEQIVRRLEMEADVPGLLDKLSELISKPLEGDTIIEMEARKKEIEQLRKEISYHTSGRKLKDYLRETTPIVDEYVSLGQYVEQVNFNDNEDANNLDDDTVHRLLVIDNYFRIASRYVKMDVFRENIIRDNVCANCGGKLINMSFDTTDADQYCVNCNTISVSDGSLAYNEGTKLQAEPRKYDVLITFKRELKQFQGIEKIVLPDDLFEKLDNYFLSIGGKTCEEVRKRGVDEYGKTYGTSLNGLCDALGQVGYSSLYKHANKIGKEYWGWKLHDLKKEMPMLINDFIVIQREFPFVEKKRSSNICSQHRALHQLLLRGIKVAITDFKLPGPEALLNSEIIWKQMVERTQYPYIPLFSVEDFDNSNTFGYVVKVCNSISMVESNRQQSSEDEYYDTSRNDCYNEPIIAC